MIVTIDSTAHVSGLDEVTRKALFSQCAIENPKYKAAVKYSPYKRVCVPEYLYTATLEKGGGISVPRGFNFGTYEEFEDAEIIDKRIECFAKYPKPLIDLYLSQKQVVGRVLENSDDPQGTFLIVLPTSRGKTITTLSLLAELGQRALIIVSTDLILNAWVKDSNKLFGIPSKEVGIIKQKDWIIGDQITVASMATLNRRQKQWPGLWEQIGAVVVDECHISPCPTLMRILANCPAKYRIGITATDKRKDGLHKILYMLFGEPFVKQSIEKADTKSSLQIKDAIIVPTRYYADYGEDYVEFIDGLTRDVERNQLIVDTVMKEVEKNKVCLVVTTRREHATELYDSFRIIGAETDLLLGGMSKDDTRKIVQSYLDGKKGIIVATSKLISLGANIPPLERLFITVPYANETEIIQLAGRIRRQHPGKEDAIIYAFCDRDIPRINQIFRKYFYPAFQKMRIPTWENRYF